MIHATQEATIVGRAGAGVVFVWGIHTNRHCARPECELDGTTQNALTGRRLSLQSRVHVTIM